MHIKIQMNGGLQAVIPAKLLEFKYVPWGQLFIKNLTMWQVLVILPHLCGVGVLCDEDQVANMCASDD
jgi:hypothetical protein